MNKSRIMSVFVVLAMLFSFANVSPAAAEDACASSGSPAVSTDKSDYGAYDIALITGSGFGCGQVFSVLVTAPNGSTLSGNGMGASGPESVTTDANGEFVLNYALYGSFPDGSTYVGQEGTYTVEVMDGAIILASATFTDSHFRYFTLGWTRQPATRTVNFQATSGWRVSPFIQLSFGDSTNQILPNTLVASGLDATGNFEIYNHSTVHTYPSDGPFVASFQSCCRISTLSNAADAFFNERITIDLRGGNNGGPASGLPPVVQMAQNQANSIVIPSGDPDGDLVSCRMSTSSESSIPSLPAGLSVSSNCVLSWTPTVGVNSLWAVQVMLESTHGGFISRTPLDFMIQIISGRPPACVLNGATNNTVTVGSPLDLWRN